MITRAKATDILKNNLFSVTQIVSDKNGDKEVEYPLYIGLGLNTSTPNEKGENFIEPSGINYKRVPITHTIKIEDAYLTNEDFIFFPENGDTWGRVAYFGIFRTKDTAEKPFYWGELATNPTDGLPGVDITYSGDEGVVPIFRPGNLWIGLDREKD